MDLFFRLTSAINLIQSSPNVKASQYRLVFPFLRADLIAA